MHAHGSSRGLSSSKYRAVVDTQHLQHSKTTLKRTMCMSKRPEQAMGHGALVLAEHKPDLPRAHANVPRRHVSELACAHTQPQSVFR